MSALHTDGWRSLLGGDAVSTPLAFRVLKKNGVAFLVLPENSGCAARAISLYPAQSRIAQITKSILRIALWCHVPLPLEATVLRVNVATPFNEFLRGLADTGDFPSVAILCGNPRTRGQRFIVLIFDGGGQPVQIVKAGLDDEARELIAREIAFLRTVPAGSPAIPTLRNEFDADGIRALALDFVQGDSPRDPFPCASLLTSWLHRDRTIPISSLPAWKKIASCCAAEPLFGKIMTRISECPAHAAIYHGDFAPWNIKVMPDGSWLVLDWERGEINGPPGWDWFHYVIQTGILVGHLNTRQLVDRLDDTLSSPEFTRYTDEAGISEIKRELLLGYLLYCVEILKPTDSMEAIRRLLEALQTRIK